MTNNFNHKKLNIKPIFVEKKFTPTKSLMTHVKKYNYNTNTNTPQKKILEILQFGIPEKIHLYDKRNILLQMNRKKNNLPVDKKYILSDNKKQYTGHNRPKNIFSEYLDDRCNGQVKKPKIFSRNNYCRQFHYPLVKKKITSS